MNEKDLESIKYTSPIMYYMLKQQPVKRRYKTKRNPTGQDPKFTIEKKQVLISFD